MFPSVNKTTNSIMPKSRSLPDEILTIVCSHLDGKQDRQSILALRAVNKQHRRLATPRVYCTVVDNINQHRHSNKPEVGPLQRVAWNLAQHPELSPLIKAIHFDQWDFIGKDKVSPLPQGVRSPTSADYSAALASADLPENVSQAILEQLCEETPAGHLSLLLALCPRLEVLEAPCGYRSFGHLITRILLGHTGDAAQVKLPPAPSSFPKISLQCLRELRMGNFNVDSAVRHILPLLCLPRLQALYVHGLGDSHIWTDHTLPEQPNTFLNLNPMVFEFDSCMLSGPGLSCILGACENPRSLTIRWRPGLWNDHLSNEPIGQAIRDFGQQVEFLHLDSTDVYKHRYNPRVRSPPSFGSFASLTKLKTLAVPRYAFPLESCSVTSIVSILPSTLQHLYVLGSGNEKSDRERAESDAFAEMCYQAKGFLPSLKKVVMVGWYHYSIYEYAGPMNHQCVDYEVEVARALSLKRIS